MYAMYSLEDDKQKPTRFGTFEVPHAARPPETDIGTSNWVEALQILTHLIKLTY